LKKRTVWCTHAQKVNLNLGGGERSQRKKILGEGRESMVPSQKADTKQQNAWADYVGGGRGNTGNAPKGYGGLTLSDAQ